MTVLFIIVVLLLGGACVVAATSGWLLAAGFGLMFISVILAIHFYGDEIA